MPTDTRHGPCIVIIIGFFFLIFGLVGFYATVEELLKVTIERFTVGSPDHKYYNEWLSDYEVGGSRRVVSLYLWHVSNPGETVGVSAPWKNHQEGNVTGLATPQMHLAGPFVYRAYNVKLNLSFAADATHIRYNSGDRYVFVPESSSTDDANHVYAQFNPSYFSAVHRIGTNESGTQGSDALQAGEEGSLLYPDEISYDAALNITLGAAMLARIDTHCAAVSMWNGTKQTSALHFGSNCSNGQFPFLSSSSKGVAAGTATGAGTVKGSIECTNATSYFLRVCTFVEFHGGVHFSANGTAAQTVVSWFRNDTAMRQFVSFYYVANGAPSATTKKTKSQFAAACGPLGHLCGAASETERRMLATYFEYLGRTAFERVHSQIAVHGERINEAYPVPSPSPGAQGSQGIDAQHIPVTMPFGSLAIRLVTARDAFFGGHDPLEAFLAVEHCAYEDQPAFRNGTTEWDSKCKTFLHFACHGPNFTYAALQSGDTLPEETAATSTAAIGSHVVGSMSDDPLHQLHAAAGVTGWRTVLTGVGNQATMGMDYFTEVDSHMHVADSSGASLGSNRYVKGRLSSADPFNGVPPNTLTFYDAYAQRHVSYRYQRLKVVEGIDTSRYVRDFASVVQEPTSFSSAAAMPAAAATRKQAIHNAADLRRVFHPTPVFLSQPFFVGTNDDCCFFNVNHSMLLGAVCDPQSPEKDPQQPEGAAGGSASVVSPITSHLCNEYRAYQKTPIKYRTMYDFHAGPFESDIFVELYTGQALSMRTVDQVNVGFQPSVLNLSMPHWIPPVYRRNDTMPELMLLPLSIRIDQHTLGSNKAGWIRDNVGKLTSMSRALLGALCAFGTILMLIGTTYVVKRQPPPTTNETYTAAETAADKQTSDQSDNEPPLAQQQQQHGKDDEEMKVIPRNDRLMNTGMAEQGHSAQPAPQRQHDLFRDLHDGESTVPDSECARTNDRRFPGVVPRARN